jgi:uncharacterized protein
MKSTLNEFQRRPLRNVLWGFPLIYLGWAFLFWSPIFGSGVSVWSFPNVIFFLLGGVSPLLAAFVLAALTGGREQLHDLWLRLIDIRRISLLWWFIVLGFWLVFNLVMAGIGVLLGVTDNPLNIAWHLFAKPGRLAFLLLLSFVFPAIEEIGLRGYYLDALQERFSTTAAGFINGAIWAIWHAPFVYFPGYYANTTFNPSLYWWLPMIVFTTLLIVQVYNHTERSILAVLIFHGIMNFTGEVLGISADMYPFVLSGYALSAMLLVLTWRRQKTASILRR